MCGIFGYIGKNQAKDIVLEGLKLLEYRGYDSAGIALIENGDITVCKRVGKITALKEATSGMDFDCKTALGHMRWATHGKPTEINSHPFLSSNGRFAVVHNGIIENFLEIKTELLAEGFKFVSDTDSEVISYLIEKYFEGDVREALTKTCGRLKGSFAIGVLSSLTPNTLYAARKDSPLVLARGEGESFLCSDTNALQHFADKVVFVENNQIVVLNAGGIDMYDFFGNQVAYKTDTVARKSQEKSESTEAYIYKEIQEIPALLQNTCNHFLKHDILENVDKDFLRQVKRIYIVGCGTAMHAGFMAMALLRRYCRLDVFPAFASEFKFDNYLVDENTLTIAVSQSGETADTLSAVRKARECGSKVIAITNVSTSTIVRESDFVINTYAGTEVSVASTKAYNCQLLTLYLLVLNFALTRNDITAEKFGELIAELAKVPAAAKEALGTEKQAKELAKIHQNAKAIFFVGRGMDFYLAKEGSLKLKELSYVHSEAYASGELKHGTLAMIEEGVVIMSPVTQSGTLSKCCGSLFEAKARGASIVTVSQYGTNAEILDVSDSTIAVPNLHEDFMAIVAVIPMQLFSYYMALNRGCDVDKPRNLAKSVTVE